MPRPTYLPQETVQLAKSTAFNNRAERDLFQQAFELNAEADISNLSSLVAPPEPVAAPADTFNLEPNPLPVVVSPQPGSREADDLLGPEFASWRKEPEQVQQPEAQPGQSDRYDAGVTVGTTEQGSGVAASPDTSTYSSGGAPRTAGAASAGGDIDNSSRQAFARTAWPYALEAAGGDPELAKRFLASAISENGTVGSGGEIGVGFNFGGIKHDPEAIGSGQYRTWESEGGQRVNQTANFAHYAGPAEGFRAIPRFLQRNFPKQWATYQQTHDAAQLYRDINAGGYATDQNWHAAIESIAARDVAPAVTGLPQSAVQPQARQQSQELAGAPARVMSFQTPNLGGPRKETRGIVVHSTRGRGATPEDEFQKTLEWFGNPKSEVSAHAVIAADGTIAQVGDWDAQTWHAGENNANRIGIELVQSAADNDRGVPFTDAQYRSLAWLTGQMANRYGFGIDRNALVGHEELEQGKHGGKTDPGASFDWNRYQQEARGYTGRPVAMTAGAGSSSPPAGPGASPAAPWANLQPGMQAEALSMKGLAPDSTDEPPPEGAMFPRYYPPAVAQPDAEGIDDQGRERFDWVPLQPLPSSRNEQDWNRRVSEEEMQRQPLPQRPGEVTPEASVPGTPGYGASERDSAGTQVRTWPQEDWRGPTDRLPPYSITDSEGLDRTLDTLMQPTPTDPDRGLGPLLPDGTPTRPGINDGRMLSYRQPLGQRPELPADEYVDPDAGPREATPGSVGASNLIPYGPEAPPISQADAEEEAGYAAQQPGLTPPASVAAPDAITAPPGSPYEQVASPGPDGLTPIYNRARQIVGWLQDEVSSAADEFVNGPKVGGPNDSLPPVSSTPGEPDYQSPVTRVQAAQQASQQRRELPLGERLVSDVGNAAGIFTGAPSPEMAEAGGQFRESVRSAVQPVQNALGSAAGAVEQATGAPPGTVKQAAEDVSNFFAPVAPALGAIRRGGGAADDVIRTLRQRQLRNAASRVAPLADDALEVAGPPVQQSMLPDMPAVDPLLNNAAPDPATRAVAALDEFPRAKNWYERTAAENAQRLARSGQEPLSPVRWVASLIGNIGYSSMLGPGTLSVNLATGLGEPLWSMPKETVRGVVRAVQTGNTAALREQGEMHAGAVYGMSRVGEAILDVLKGQGKYAPNPNYPTLSQQTVNPIAQIVAQATEFPGRVWSGLPDAIFGTVAQHAGEHRAAAQIATNAGLKGAEWKAEVARLLEDSRAVARGELPTSPDVQRVVDEGAAYASRQSYRDELGEIGKQAQSLAKLGNKPGAVGTWASPFFTSIWNAGLRQAEKSLIGAFMNTQPTKLDRRYDALVGSAVLLALGNYAMQGKVTGSGPSDPKERELLQREGWQPYSTLTTGPDGNQYYVPNRVYSLFETPLNVAGEVHDAFVYQKPDMDARAQVTDAARRLGQVIRQNPYALSGIVSILEVPAYGVAPFAAEQLTRLTPGAATARTIGMAVDPQDRTVDRGKDVPLEDEIIQRWQLGVGARGDLPVAPDAFGQPKENPRPGVLAIGPKMGRAKDDPIGDVFRDAQVMIGDPKTEVRVTSSQSVPPVPLRPRERRFWDQKRGEVLLDAGQSISTDPDWKDAPKEVKEKVLKTAMDMASKAADDQVKELIGDEEITRRIDAEIAKREKAAQR